MSLLDATNATGNRGAFEPFDPWKGWVAATVVPHKSILHPHPQVTGGRLPGAKTAEPAGP